MGIGQGMAFVKIMIQVVWNTKNRESMIYRNYQKMCINLWAMPWVGYPVHFKL